MMAPQTLRYQHTGGCKQIIDARLKPDPVVSLDDCYFLGFRITCEHTVRFHHAWIIANDHESFLVALQAESESVTRESQGDRVLEVDLVFMHNLRLRQHNYMSEETKQETIRRIGIKLNRRDDEHFAVVGVSDDQWCEVLDFRVKDALMAIRLTRSHSQKICGKTLLPIAVCQAHPVTREFDALFHREAEFIKILLCSETSAERH